MGLLPRSGSGRKGSTMESSFPNNWYVIGFSDDVKKGQVKTVKYFSREIVLFRGDDGHLNALEPYCPHLGAHLGHGGSVSKNKIRCPFHGWKFTGNGKLSEIPYCKKLPPKAKINTWPMEEHQGLIFIFYSKDRSDPPYKMPRLPFLDNPKWKFRSKIRLKLKGRIQDSKENPPDFMHFLMVHKITDKKRIEELKISNWKEDGPYFNYTLNLPYKLMGITGTASYHFRYFCQTFEAFFSS